MKLKDKVAVVTGASSGIGQAVAVALAKEGAKIIFTYNSNEKGANETLRQVGENGKKIKVDFAKRGDIANLFKVVKEKYGKFDILVNNAGGDKANGLFEMSGWRETFEINLFAVVYCTEMAVELMKGSGRIINISSIYSDGKVASKKYTAYSAAKAALNSFTQTMAKNLAPGILVNAVAPGYVDTPGWGEMTKEEKKQEGKDQLIDRMIQSEEVADLTVAVIKNDAVTGEVIVIDGGLSLKTV